MTAALPVAVDLPDALAAEVMAWAEVEAGWQVVALDGPPAPALLLTARARPGPPCVLVVDGTPSAEAVRAGLRAGAIDVVGWPDERDRLLAAAAMSAAPASPAREPPTLRVAGSGGGAGTSTVALAIGALLAWSGRSVLVLGGDDLLCLCGLDPWTGPGTRELALLQPQDAAAEAATLARAVPGVDRLAVLGGGAQVERTVAWPAEVVVADMGVLSPGEAQVGALARAPASIDLLVARPDVTVARARELEVPVLVAGQGPLDAAGVRRRLGRPPLAWLSWSARVARAGLHGRVPSALPGRWLSELAAALARLPPRAAARTSAGRG